jgi:hypothetical protein
MADVVRVSTTVVVVPMDSVEVAAAAVDQAMIILASGHSVTMDEVFTTGEVVAAEADTMVALLLPSAQGQASRTSTSCAILPRNLVSS